MNFTTFEIDTTSVVIHAVDYDCDGVGLSWTRVNVPTYMVEAWRKAKTRRDQLAGQQANEYERALRDSGLVTDDALVRIMDNFRPSVPYFDGEVDGWREAMVSFAIETSDHTGYGWDCAMVLSLAEFDDDVLDGKRNDAQYGDERAARDVAYFEREGYYSEFASRIGA